MKFASPRSTLFVFTAAASVAAATRPASADVVAGPIRNEANGHYYYLLRQGVWSTSQRKARSIGGHLVTINDAAENAWVFDQFSQYDGVDRNLWIGLNDANRTNNDFVWVSGEPINATLNAGLFAPGQPDNLFGENYVHIIGPAWVGSTGIGKWNDTDNLLAFTFGPQGNGGSFGGMYGVIELNGPPIPPVTPPTTADATWATNNPESSWTAPANWIGGAVPDGVGATAQIQRSFTGTDRTFFVVGPQTLGTLIVNDTDTASTTRWIVSGIDAFTLANTDASTVPLIHTENPPRLTNGLFNEVAMQIEVKGKQGFTKTGRGILSLVEENPQLAGPIRVEQGLLIITAPTGLGVDASVVRVAFDAGLALTPGIDGAITDKLILNGNGIPFDQSGALRLAALSGDHVGPVFRVPEVELESPAKISVVADPVNRGRLVVQTLSGSGDLTKGEPGKLDLASDNNAAFTGKIRFAPLTTATAVDCGEIVVAAEGSLGPNPAEFEDDQILFDFNGYIETTTSQTFDDANRGITVGNGTLGGQADGGGFAVAPGTVLTVRNKIVGPAVAGGGELMKKFQGELRLEGELGGFAGTLRSFQGQTTLVSPATLAAVNVSADSRVRAEGTGAANFPGWQTRSLVIASGGQLDLFDSGLRIDWDTAGGSPLEAVALMLRDGRIVTTNPAANARVGFAEASELGLTSFLGVAVDDTTVLLRRTRAGDANLDARVDFADLLALAAAYGSAGSWADGDSNYDGLVNFADLLALAQNYGTAALVDGGGDPFTPAFAADWARAVSLVPEPAATTFLLASGMMRARRRKPATSHCVR